MAVLDAVAGDRTPWSSVGQALLTGARPFGRGVWPFLFQSLLVSYSREHSVLAKYGGSLPCPDAIGVDGPKGSTTHRRTPPSPGGLRPLGEVAEVYPGASGETALVSGIHIHGEEIPHEQQGIAGSVRKRE